MKHLRMIVSLCLLGVFMSISSPSPTEGRSSLRAEAQQFQVNQYHKAILHDNVLYMNTAPKVLEEHHGSLIRVPLSQYDAPQVLWDYVGVSVFGRSDGQSVFLGNQYAFCWDIVGQDLVAINIEESTAKGDPSFVLFRIPLADVAVLRQMILQEGDVFLGKSAISDLAPLADLFSLAPYTQRSHVFFDIVPFDRQKFHLYIAYDGKMTIWNYDRAMHEVMMSTRDWSVKSSYERYMGARETSWVPIRSFPIEFEGPFRIIQLNETIYIFSEHLRTVYRYEGDELVPLLHLPPLLEDDSPTGFEQVFIVDKDHQRVIFWAPSADHPDDPDVITLGKSASLPEELVPALQAAMTLMPSNARPQ